MKTKITILALLLCFPLFLAAQNHHSWDGIEVAPNSKFRALTVCINIIYDQHPDTNQISDVNNVWPLLSATHPEEINGENTIPTYLLDILDTVYVPGGTHGMTRLYGESSFDSLQVTGDFIVVNLKESRVLNTYAKFCYDSIFKAAIDVINEQGFNTLFEHNNITDYDYKNEGKIFYTQVLIRNITHDYGGFNSGEGRTYYTYPPHYNAYVNIEDSAMGFHCVTIQCVGNGNFSPRPTNVLTHEFSHTLLGGNGFHTSGGNHRATDSYSPFIGIQRGWGIIGASGNALIGCNGYERWRLHWKHPSSIDYISARNPMNTLSVVSDVSVADGNTSFLLRDFVTYGDAVRIRLPYKSKAACSNQYIWLENHKVGLNDKLDFYDYFLFDSCRPQGRPGIYAYYQVGRDILESPNSYNVWNEGYDCDNLRFIPAEGYYDYHKVDVDTPYNCQCINWDDHYYYHVRGNSNPLCGAQDMQSHFSPRDTDNILNRKMEYNIWRKMIGNDIIDSLVQMGDERDAFSTHSKINMGTNPSTCNTNTFYHKIYMDNPTVWTGYSHRNNDTTFLTGLSIEMDFNADNDAIVNIRWDDWDITNDTRWAGRIALKDTAILNTPYNILLTQNETPAQVYRDSVTGTFSPRTVMVCHTNSYFEQKPNTTVELEQSSTLALRSGSRYVIGDSAQLVVGAGCTLKVEYGAFVDVAGSGKIVIDSGGVAEIHGTVALDSLCRVFVNRGGLMLLDGGKLTDCSNNKMWQGIRLSGDKWLPQTSPRQGKVIMRNNARIEYARTAIATWDGADYNTAGGIIQCEDAEFYNNRRSIEFMEYTYSANGNFSYFDRCTFNVNDMNHFANAGSSFLSHVTMWHVKYIPFRGCTFVNYMSGAAVGHAIYSIDAHFLVNEYCALPNPLDCTCSSTPTASTFYGFNRAIESDGGTNGLTFTVKKSSFNQNGYGVYSSGIDNIAVTENDFDMTFSASEPSYGLYTSTCSGYTIEGNNFHSTDWQSHSGYRQRFGIYTVSSGTAENMIYRNTFNQLLAATVADGINALTGSYSVRPGLQYKCNTYTQTVNDIYVQKYGRIRDIQGSSTQIANNQFSHMNVNSYGDFYATHNIVYHHSTINSHTPIYYSNSIQLVSYPVKPTACASTLCPDPLFLSGYYDQLAETYDNLSENSDDDELLADMSAELAQVKNSLMAELNAAQDLDIEAIRKIHSKEKSVLARYQLAETYILTKDYNSAEEILADIPSEFELSETENDEHGNYMHLYNLEKSVRETGRTIAELTAGEIDEVRAIAETNTDGRTASRAKGILCFFYGICEEPEEPEISDFLPKDSLPKLSMILDSIGNPTDSLNINDSLLSMKGYESFFGKNSTTYHSMTNVWNIEYNKNIDEKTQKNAIIYNMTLARMYVGDTTTIKNKLYRKVTAEYAVPSHYPMPDSLPYYSFSSPIAYIREDTLLGQLYFLESLDEEEYLVCDMSLSIGDTFYSRTEWYNDYVAMVVDSISYSYNHDKTIYFNSNKMVEDIFNLDYAKVPICFMEGIGSCFGPTGSGAYYPISEFDSEWPVYRKYNYVLLCAEKDDTIAYMAMGNLGCEPLNLVWGANVEENTALQLQVYPNPASQRVLVEVEGWNGAGTLRLINSVGMVLQTVKMEDAITELNISKYANGLYTILYTDDKNNRSAVKFVKQE